MRIISCMVGDGNISKESKARWIQKDITPLKIIIDKHLGINSTFHRDANNIYQLAIPSIYGKIFSNATKIKKLSEKEILEKSLKLSKDFRISLLISLIEDEANIDYKSHIPIKIRLSNKDYLEIIKNLCDSLNYDTSSIKKYTNNH